jgi:PST family polysaccharide transporter
VFRDAVAWSGGARWFAQLVSWASTLIVARLLRPEDYGIVAMAAVVTGFMAVVSELGIGVTVVTLRDLTPLQVAQLNGLALLTGLAAFAIAIAAAPVAAAVYGRPEIAPIVVALAVTLMLAAARAVPAALLQKQLRFKLLAAMEAIQSLAGAAIALAAALAGWRHWALISSIVGAALVWTVLVVAVQIAPLAFPRRQSLDRALTFTRHQVTGTVAWYCYSNADFAIAGVLLGTKALGVYAMAWTLARIIPERVTSIVMRLTPAFFAAVREDRAQLREWVYRLTETVAAFTFPALIGLAVTASDVVPLVAGPQWTSAVVPVRLLAIYGAFDVTAQLITRALIADGDVRFTSNIGLALLIVLPPAFIAGAQWGPAGIAFMWVTIAPMIRVLLLRRATRRLGLEFGRYVQALVPAVTGAIGLALAAQLTSMALINWPPVARASAAICFGGAAYAAVLWRWYRARVINWRNEWFPREMAA